MAEAGIPAMLLAAAAQDLSAARVLASTPGLDDALVGFHAQQAVEKALNELNPYAVEARYGGLGQGGLDRARALTAANDVLQWARAQVVTP